MERTNVMSDWASDPLVRSPQLHNVRSDAGGGAEDAEDGDLYGAGPSVMDTSRALEAFTPFSAAPESQACGV